MTASHRGLTLIEVLASVVLLALVASACIPLLQRSMRIVSASSCNRSDFQIELAQLVQSIFESPSDFDIPNLAEVELISVAWPGNPEREPVKIERLVGRGQLDEELKRLQGSWLRISYSGQTMHRWIPASETQLQREHQ